MAVELRTFLGEWRDSLGNTVNVEWAKPGQRGGQLNVLLSKPRSNRDPIKLDVKAIGRGRFVCGHYDLDLDESNEDRIVWADCRNRGKSSIWLREGVKRERSRSRSRSRGRSARGLGGRHQLQPIAPQASYGLPSPAAYWAGAVPSWQSAPAVSAVASSGPTPGAWVPPSAPAAVVDTSSSQLALPALDDGGPRDSVLDTEVPMDSVSRLPISRPAPVKVVRPPPLVDEMEEFDRLLLQCDEHTAASSSRLGVVGIGSRAATAVPPAMASGLQAVKQEPAALQPVKQEPAPDLVQREAERKAQQEKERLEKQREAERLQEEQRERERQQKEQQEREQQEKAQREKEQREKEQREKEQREKEQREKEQREQQQQQMQTQQPKSKRKKPLSLPMAVKIELPEEDEPVQSGPAVSTLAVETQESVAEVDASSRDPRRRPASGSASGVDPRKRKPGQDTSIPEPAEPKVEVFVQQQQDTRDVPEPAASLSVEVLAPPATQPVAKQAPPAPPVMPATPSTPMTPLTPMTPVTTVAPGVPALPKKAAPPTPMAPATPGTPAAQSRAGVTAQAAPAAPKPQDEAQRRLMAYSALLLGAGAAEEEEQAPWKRQKRRRSALGSGGDI
eukprot:TRINITY_DN108662_c0_g1_i1.p1 TRINITY_DN108662_c0_g1~~TRINITY_DN108662_c0_g1_i1.p1  ORF type:complete len:618 (+),score=150.85 TRINITY_DN108662_c0_g1_i1:78-1931(+)